MYYPAFIVGLAALSNANPLPQAIDFAGVAAAGPPPSPTIAIGVASQIISYNPSAAASAAAAQISAEPLQRRTSGTCAAQPLGSGPLPSPDTASAFLAYGPFASIASAAPIPAGYNLAFTNVQASNNANGYMGFTTLTTYDTNACAQQCSNTAGCSAINIYFERDPTQDPGPGCPNPPSTTQIKCVFWGGPVTTANANNYGQSRSSFQVVIAGSNGYTISTIPSVPGYSGPNNLGSNAINAPLDCNGYDTYMGYQLFNDGAPFDAGRCAAACTAQSNYNLAHPSSDGTAPRICTFFNAYILYENGVSQGQICSLYNETWANSYATNSGQTRGSNVFTIGMSVSFSNSTNPGVCVKSSTPTTTAPTSPTVTPVPTISGFVSQGCFGGGFLLGKAFSGYTMPGSTVSLESCAAYCKDYTYMSVENGNGCSCGFTASGSQITPASSGCSTPCSGNSKEICGGFGRNNLFKNPANTNIPAPPQQLAPRDQISFAGFVAQGCFNGGFLSGPSFSNSSVSPEFCAAFCKGYTYMSTENGNGCSCGFTPSGSGGDPVPNFGCFTSCAGNSTELCGGFGRRQLYKSLGIIGNYEAVGCFGGGFTATKQNVGNTNSLESCAAFCGTSPYFSVENGNVCQCGTQANGATQLTGCTTPCTGNSNESCGGFGRNNLYSHI